MDWTGLGKRGVCDFFKKFGKLWKDRRTMAWGYLTEVIIELLNRACIHAILVFKTMN